MTNKYTIPLIPKNGGATLIFSLPQTCHYQTISDLKIPEGKILREAKWKNKIFTHTLNDVSWNKNKLSFKANLHPYTNHIDKKWTINDYSVKPEKNRFINGFDPKIIKLVKNVVGRETNLAKVINELFIFTRKYLKYGKPIEGLYPYKQAMEERITDCGGYSTFLASLLAAVKIPSRLVVGYIVKPNLFQKIFPKYLILNTKYLHIHAWLEVMLPNDEWFPVDAQTAKFGALPANRLATSFGCDFEINIDNKKHVIDLLQNPIYI